MQRLGQKSLLSVSQFHKGFCIMKGFAGMTKAWFFSFISPRCHNAKMYVFLSGLQAPTWVLILLCET